MAGWTRRMMEISFYRGHPPFRPPLHIDSIALSGLTFVSAADAFVGLITTYMSTQPFTGSLAVGGADAASFKIVGSNLVTNGTIAAGTYSIALIATQATANNSPFTSPTFTITGTATQSFVSLGLSNASFIPSSTAAATVGNVLAVLNPASPASTATISFDGGTNDALFQLTNGGVLPCVLQAKQNIGVGNYTIRLKATQAGITGSPFSSGNIAVTGLPAFVSLGLDNTSFIPNGNTPATVGNVVATMNPGAAASTAAITLGGTDAASFQLTNGGVLPCAVQAKSTTTTIRPYTVTLTATQAGIANSPFPSGSITVTGVTFTITESWNPGLPGGASIANTTAVRTVVEVGTATRNDLAAFTGAWAFASPNYDGTAITTPAGVSVVGPVASNYALGQAVSSGDTAGITSTGLFALVINANRTVCVIVNPNGPGLSGITSTTTKRFNAVAYQ